MKCIVTQKEAEKQDKKKKGRTGKENKNNIFDETFPQSHGMLKKQKKTCKQQTTQIFNLL